MDRLGCNQADRFSKGFLGVRPNLPSTPKNSCSACRCLIKSTLGQRLTCVIGCIGAVYRVEADPYKNKLYF